MDTSFFDGELIAFFDIIVLKKGIDLSYLDKNIMLILNVIMDILIGAAFIINVCSGSRFLIDVDFPDPLSPTIAPNSATIFNF